MRAQLIERDGGEPAIAHDGLVLRRFRDKALACRAVPDSAPAAFDFVWRGEERLVVPAWRGALRFTRDDTFGVPEAVLQGLLRLAARRGRADRAAARRARAGAQAGVPGGRRAGVAPRLAAAAVERGAGRAGGRARHASPLAGRCAPCATLAGGMDGGGAWAAPPAPPPPPPHSTRVPVRRSLA